MVGRISTSLMIGICLAVTACIHPPAITSSLDLEMNPNGRTPLAGLIRFTTDQPTRATLTISDGEHTATVTPNDTFTTEHELMVLGLRPGRLNTVEVSVENERGEVGTTASVDFTTDPLPDDFPPIDVRLSRPARMEPGYRVLAVTREINLESDLEYGVFVAIDVSGDVVWYFDAGHPVDEPRRLSNGNVLYQTLRTRTYEIDMLGNVVNEWAATGFKDDAPSSAVRVDTDTFHHDVVVLPSGNQLALSTELREFERYPTSLEDLAAEWGPAKVVGNLLIEYEEDGRIVREWHDLDHLDPLRLGYGSLGTRFYRRVYGDALGETGYDWSHANGLEYDASDDTAIVSFNYQSVVAKIDLDTSEIRWMLGDPQGWGEHWRPLFLEPTEDLRWAWHHHAPELTPNDTLLLFDNGSMQALPPGPYVYPPDTYSRAVEYRIDEAAHSVEQIWSYGGPGEDWFFSGFVSEADWLPQTENVMITVGGRIRKPDGSPGVWPGEGRGWVTLLEVTHTKTPEKVWEIVIDDPAIGFFVYRSEHFASLYP